MKAMLRILRRLPLKSCFYRRAGITGRRKCNSHLLTPMLASRSQGREVSCRESASLIQLVDPNAREKRTNLRLQVVHLEHTNLRSCPDHQSVISLPSSLEKSLSSTKQSMTSSTTSNTGLQPEVLNSTLQLGKQ